MKIRAICEDGKGLTFASTDAVREYFGRENYRHTEIVSALEREKPLFKDGKKYFLDEDFDYEPERDS